MNEAMPSLERIDGSYAGEQGNRESPGAKGFSYTSVGQSQYGRPIVSCTSLGAPIGVSAISTTEVSLPLMFSGEGGSLGFSRHFVLNKIWPV